MPKYSVHLALMTALGFSAVMAGLAHAYLPEGDLLKIKGYSPEVIQAAAKQRSRQEWKEPSAPKQSPTEKFFHNIYYGNWTGGIDDFGSQVIRPD